jgi:hypothetical protein
MPRREDVARTGGTAGRALRSLVMVLGPLAAAAPHSARAATFDVNATILCPASLTAAGTFNPAFTTAVNSPCAGIRVVAMDSDDGFDGFCGAAFTDAAGRVRFRAECGDIVNPLPEVYLRVEARSDQGFSVGVAELNIFEAIVDVLTHGLDRAQDPIPVPDLDGLRTHRTFVWLSPTTIRVGPGQTLVDFGRLVAGAPATGFVSAMAGRQFSAAQFAMFRLGASTRHRPMHFNYTVNIPLGGVTNAFVAYDTVVGDATAIAGPPPGPAPVLASTAHEIGHVLYNTYHSGSGHWVNDCAEIFCFRNSPRCGSVSLGLAWYEGFADFVSDHVHQQWSFPNWNWAIAPPAPGCALEPPPPPPMPGAPAPLPAVDMSVEGNVQGLLNNIYFGPVRPALLAAANPNSPGLGFSCPPGTPSPSPSPDPNGPLVCTVPVPVTCARGQLRIDSAGVLDDCLDHVEDPRCARAPNRNSPNFSCPYDPVEQVNRPNCGRAVVSGPGRDGCPTVVPAIHTVPNGRPRARPDGSPDMTLGASAAGLAWFSLPTLDDVVEWVREAGTDDHRAKEFWQRRILPWCQRGDGSLRARYCNPGRSPSFVGEILTLDPAMPLR